MSWTEYDEKARGMDIESSPVLGPAVSIGVFLAGSVMSMLAWAWQHILGRIKETEEELEEKIQEVRNKNQKTEEELDALKWHVANNLVTKEFLRTELGHSVGQIETMIRGLWQRGNPHAD